MSDTSIEWCCRPGTHPKTWNPTRGCEIISPGCARCYAMRQAHRHSGKGRAYEGLTVVTGAGAVWTGEVREVSEMLELPLQWRAPCTVFVDSMSDLFHDDVSNEFIAAVFGVMAACPQHAFIILTKRAQRMREWFKWVDTQWSEPIYFDHPEVTCNTELRVRIPSAPDRLDERHVWPLRNVWLGVSVEDQKHADLRIPELLATPAAVRLISAEPLLERLAITRYIADPCDCLVPALDGAGQHAPSCKSVTRTWGLDWVIAGGESGAGARAFDVAWARSLRDQCANERVPFFMKQLGAFPLEHDEVGRVGFFADKPKRIAREHGGSCYVPTSGLISGKGDDPGEWPPDLRIRQYPAEVRR